MIPTMLFVGFVLGMLPLRSAPRVGTTLAVAVVASLVFGIAVGEAFGGTALALVNTGVGILFGFAVQSIGHAVGRVSPNKG